SFGATPQGHLGGKKVRELEEAFCEYFNIKYAISMNSATACLHSALIACSKKWEVDVIVPAMSFSSTASCAVMAGKRAEFADITPDTFCIDAKEINYVSQHTAAIIPVHLHGHPADMEGVIHSARACLVIEDCSQAIGATYKDKYVGTIGDCGVFSFNQNKVITAGSGGMLITNDDEIAYIARLVRNHGETQSDILGYNYRMGEIEAAILIEQLKKLDGLNEQRIELADYLTEQLSGVDGITTPITQPDCKNVFFRYAMKYNEDKVGIHRNEFQDRLLKQGVFFGDKDYGKPLYLQPVHGGKEGLCPVAERLYTDEIMVTDCIKPPATKSSIRKIAEIVKNEVDRCQKNHLK
ncbi:MAG: DegT/DnrJ/EryC1/StrS family aminotransferase, partial [Candidatus Bathyarchaeota archaeon]|nr:DegT/DnrJ/EryC1/StrS family aminotransferase [Candidatus Bathyarchaeota archaeon]